MKLTEFEKLPEEIALTKDQLRKIVIEAMDAVWDAVHWEESPDTGVMWLRISRIINGEQ